MPTSTLSQIATRAHEGHLRELEHFADGEWHEWRATHPASKAGAVIGARKVRGTLEKWGCLEERRIPPVGSRCQFQYRLTNRGRDVLETLRECFPSEAARIAAVRMENA